MADIRESQIIVEIAGGGAPAMWHTATQIEYAVLQGNTAPGGVWHEFVICGHAVKEIEGWYIGGIRQDPRSAEGDPDSTAYWLVPGYSAWDAAGLGPSRVVTRNGRDYTIIYALEGTFVDGKQIGHSPLDIEKIRGGATPLSVNVKGIEDLGDGTGALITSSLQIYKHAMKNWIVGDYQSGAWLSTPTFPDTDAVPMIDEASFDAADAVSALRIAGGYVGAGGFGLEGTFLSVRDAIRVLNTSCDVDSGYNRKVQFFVSMVDDSPSVVTAARDLTDVDDILQGSFDIEDDFSNHFNVVPYYYAKDYVATSNTPWRGQDVAFSASSIASYLSSLKMVEQELLFVRDQATADDIGARKLTRHKDPPRKVRFSLAADGHNVELAELVALTHFAGVGSSGWSRQIVRITRHTSSPDGSVEFEGYDIARLLATIALGDEVALAPTWGSAPVADRQYGYLGDEVSGTFGDGSPIKRLH